MAEDSMVNATKRMVVDPVTRHAVAGAVPAFMPPPVPTSIHFSPGELALSVARNLALRATSRRLLEALGASAVELIRALLEPDMDELQVCSTVSKLGDAAQNHFSHDLAVGVAGLLMEDMGYAWRANGKEVLRGKGRKPDYVWSRGKSGEAVVSEVKGATARKATKMALNRRTEKGFEEQALPWLGKRTTGRTRIKWGYGIGVHAPGGGNSSCVVHEPEPTQVQLDGDLFVPIEIAASHYAAVFRLLGCFDIAEFLMRERELAGPVPEVTFRVILRDETRLLVPDESNRRSVADRIMGRSWRFAISETAAEAILEYEARFPHDPDPALIPRQPPRERERMPIAPDGLALVGAREPVVERVRWSADAGSFMRLPA
jgi:hypothetical protein